MEARPVTTGDVSVYVGETYLPNVKEVFCTQTNAVETERPMNLNLGLYYITLTYELFIGMDIDDFRQHTQYDVTLITPFESCKYRECAVHQIDERITPKGTERKVTFVAPIRGNLT